MNRQERITGIQNKINEFYKNNLCTESERQLLSEIFDEVEILRQPISLADFLGWEEDVEYEWNEYRYKISGGNILYYSLFSKKYEMFCNKDLLRLREAKKVREKRFNLILQKGYRKLFDLLDNEKYLTMDIDEETIFNSKYLNDNSKYQVQFTLEEIENIKKKFKINLSIYDVVEVQE